MKAVKISIVVLLALTFAVTANSLYISHLTKEFSKELEAVNVYTNENLTEKFESLFKRFKKAERFISITVSHDDTVTNPTCTTTATTNVLLPCPKNMRATPCWALPTVSITEATGT